MMRIMAGDRIYLNNGAIVIARHAVRIDDNAFEVTISNGDVIYVEYDPGNNRWVQSSSEEQELIDDGAVEEELDEFREGRAGDD